MPRERRERRERPARASPEIDEVHNTIATAGIMGLLLADPEADVADAEREPAVEGVCEQGIGECTQAFSRERMLLGKCVSEAGEDMSRFLHVWAIMLVVKMII